MNTLVIKAI